MKNKVSDVSLKRWLLPFVLCGAGAAAALAALTLPDLLRPKSALIGSDAPPMVVHPRGKAIVASDPDVHFVDVAAKAGLHYRWSVAGPRPLDFLQTIGNGCAFLDYDNDGNLDILLVGPKLALYKGDGHGHFTDVTHAMGLDKLHGHFLGCAVGDYDNDGYDDIYVSGWHTGLLLHNEGGKGFRDVTKEAGLGPQPWGTSAAFADVDNDGRLDLYVGNYVEYDPNLPKKYTHLCQYGHVFAACPPDSFRAIPGVLYHNEGSGRFRDVSDAWGAKQAHGAAMGVAFADYDGTGHPSLEVANDGKSGDLLHNLGGRFQNVGRRSGTSESEGRPYSGMGVDWGDYDNDGRLDLSVGTFETQQKCVFRNLGGGIFEEKSSPLGVTANAYPYVTFGVKWLDYNNDGWLDLLIANGHVQDNVAQFEKTATYRQPTQLFENIRGRRLAEVSRSAGPAFGTPIVGRGIATGDFDNDGRIDALVVDGEGAPLLLRNVTRPVGHWLSLKLVGVKSNRDGAGALVTVTADGLTQTRLCHTDGSYFSASDVRVQVGLGKASRASRLSIRWPSGHTDTFSDVRADRRIFVREGNATLSK